MGGAAACFALVMARPLILGFDDGDDCAGRLARDLARYANDYDVHVETSAAAAVERLRAAHEVALVVAGRWRDPSTGVELLREAQALHPSSKRLLLRDWYQWVPAELIRETGGDGALDRCINKPWDPADIGLHPTVTELLSEWTRANRPRLEVVRLDGPERSRRAHELRDLLERNGVPYTFHAREAATDDLVVRLLDGRVLVGPSNTELLEALGMRTQARRSRYDLAIVGAGPAGLAAAVSASSEGLESGVIEREAPRGPAGSTTQIRN
jgi:thioredoxin reductase (NADPH)